MVAFACDLDSRKINNDQAARFLHIAEVNIDRLTMGNHEH